jgi:ABC-type transporter Mla MlaB component
MTQVRREGAATILELDGKLVFGEPVVEFRSRWAEALATGTTCIILDLSRVPYVDSSGIGTLVRCLAAFAGLPANQGEAGSGGNSRGKLKVSGAPAGVRNALKIARVDNLFDHYENIEAALAPSTGVSGS